MRYVLYLNRHLFSFLQAFQLEFLFSIASLFHYCGIIGSCMGNNILLRKQAYIDCGGQDAIGYNITEDRALLYHFHKHRRKIKIVTPFAPTAYTFPHYSFHSFFEQMQRWAHGGFNTGSNLLAIGLFFTLQNMFTILAAFGVISVTNQIITFSNFLLTWLLIIIMFKKNRSLVTSVLFPAYYLFLIVEYLVLPLMVLLKKNSSWKGRTIK